jgi:glutamyl-tRNA synthetase
MVAGALLMADGRFAPSPTGPLHIGNLRTALLAWLFARSTESRFVVRMEDLDAAVATREYEAAQLHDLAALGLDWDGAVVRQSERRKLYDDAIARLDGAGLVYACFCTRREIREAAAAPNAPDQPEGAYPGTCRQLSARQRSARERSGRPPALRLRAGGVRVTVRDRLAGELTAVVDDIVLRRNDGVAAYNLAVVIDDAAQGIGEVVRGDDLLPSTPRQVHLARLLGLTVPAYAHVPLVLGSDGARLAKRHGAITLADRGALGQSALSVRSQLAATVGLSTLCELPTMDELLRRFDPDRLPREPWTFE